LLKRTHQMATEGGYRAVPDAHSRHDVADDWPGMLLYVPVLQLLKTPLEGQYPPTGHARHSPDTHCLRPPAMSGLFTRVSGGVSGGLKRSRGVSQGVS
jgi:hypothetical protein